MINTLVLSVICCGLASAVPSSQVPLASLASAGDPVVFLVSIDGLRNDYIARADALNISIPNIQRLIAGGAYGAAESVYPSLTYPAHTSMITGVNPDRHCVYSNEKFDPTHLDLGLYMFSRDVCVPTLFDLALERGIKSSAVSWPLSAFSESIDYIFPDAPINTPVEFDYYYNGAIKSLLFKSAFDTPEKLHHLSDRVRLSLTRSILVAHSESGSELPRLNALHLIEFDHAEHVYGAFSPEAIAMLEEEDRILGELLALVDTHVGGDAHLFVVSDHGFTNLNVQVNPQVMMQSLGLLDSTAEWKAAPYFSAGIFAVYLNPLLASEDVADVQSRVLQMTSYFESNSDKYGIDRVIVGYDHVVTAKLGGFPGAYAILEAKEGYWFSPHTDGLLLKEAKVPGYLGSHGYNPKNDFMQAVFIGSGPNVKRGMSLNTVRMIDFAPTIAHVLGFEMKGVDGNVLSEIFN